MWTSCLGIHSYNFVVGYGDFLDNYVTSKEQLVSLFLYKIHPSFFLVIYTLARTSRTVLIHVGDEWS